MVWKNACLCDPAVYLKNWTLLDFHTWRVSTPPKWQVQALTNIFSTILEAIKMSKKSAFLIISVSSVLLVEVTQ